MLLVFAMEAMTALAQTSGTGAVAGTLTDPSGAIVAEAFVKVTSVATGEARRVSSGPNGAYYVGLLLPGQYNVQVSSAGFRTADAPNVPVVVGSTTRLDIRLEVGGVAEKVTVESAVEQI